MTNTLTHESLVNFLCMHIKIVSGFFFLLFFFLCQMLLGFHAINTFMGCNKALVRGIKLISKARLRILKLLIHASFVFILHYYTIIVHVLLLVIVLQQL